MQRAFEHFEELEMIGGCIYVGDKLIAFTYGSAVNDHTFDTQYADSFQFVKCRPHIIFNRSLLYHSIGVWYQDGDEELKLLQGHCQSDRGREEAPDRASGVPVGTWRRL